MRWLYRSGDGDGHSRVVIEVLDGCRRSLSGRNAWNSIGDSRGGGLTF